MKEHPILFNGSMVRAILESRKTQTRRAMQWQPPAEGYQISRLVESTARDDRKNEGKLHWIKIDGMQIIDQDQHYFECPYGQPGDRLWVRETWAQASDISFIYLADSQFDACKPGDISWRWRPSIHMPRKVSRILLEVISVKVERLQDISEDDAKEEGVEPYGSFYPDYQSGIDEDGEPNEFWTNAKKSFKSLWDSINTKRDCRWDSNPWVWVVKLKRVDGTEGAR